MYEVEQLLWLEKDSDLTWIHPNKPIFDVIDDEHVDGTWNNERLNKFQVKNLNDIVTSFNNF